MSKKKVRDCSKKEIFNAIYNNSQTSVGDDNCKFCKYSNPYCNLRCNNEYESCIDYEKIIVEVGDEEIEGINNEILEKEN